MSSSPLLSPEASIFRQDFAAESIRNGGDQTVAQISSSRVAEHVLGNASSFEPVVWQDTPLVDDSEPLEKFLRQIHFSGVGDSGEEFEFDRTDDRIRVELLDQVIGNTRGVFRILAGIRSQETKLINEIIGVDNSLGHSD